MILRFAQCLLVAFFAALGPAGAHGGDEGSKAEEEGGSSVNPSVWGRVSHELRDRTRFGADTRLEWAQGLDRTTQKLNLILLPRLDFALPLDIGLTAVGRIRADVFDELEPGFPSQASVSDASRRAFAADRVEFELREFYLEVPLSPVFITLGKQQIVWGKADGLKVLDVVNPQYFREFILEDFEESRIPLWALTAELPFQLTEADLNFQFVWTPDKTYHVLPSDGGLYEFTSPLIVPQIPPGVSAQVRRPSRPSRFFEDSDIGTRLSGFWKGWDFSLLYFYNYFDVPVFPIKPLPPPPGGGVQVLVEPEYRRTHLVGATFSNAFGDVTARGELGYWTDRWFSTQDSRRSNGLASTGEFIYVLGLDWYGFKDSLISLQLFQSILSSDPRGIFRDQVRTTLTLLLRRKFLNEDLAAEVLWVQNVNDGDGLVRPSLRYELSDEISLWSGFDVFYGTARGLFGEFNGEDRFVLGVEYSF